MENLTYSCSFLLVKCWFFMLGLFEGIASHVNFPCLFLISGVNAPLNNILFEGLETYLLTLEFL